MTLFTPFAARTIFASADANPTSNLLTLVLPLVVMFGLMYLIIIRPQKRKEKDLKKQVEAMAVGDQAVTIGGLIGKVVNIKDDEITLSTSVANTLVTFKKSAINTVIKPLSD